MSHRTSTLRAASLTLTPPAKNGSTSTGTKAVNARIEAQAGKRVIPSCKFALKPVL